MPRCSASSFPGVDGRVVRAHAGDLSKVGRISRDGVKMSAAGSRGGQVGDEVAVGVDVDDFAAPDRPGSRGCVTAEIRKPGGQGFRAARRWRDGRRLGRRSSRPWKVRRLSWARASSDQASVEGFDGTRRECHPAARPLATSRPLSGPTNRSVRAPRARGCASAAPARSRRLDRRRPRFGSVPGLGERRRRRSTAETALDRDVLGRHGDGSGRPSVAPGRHGQDGGLFILADVRRRPGRNRSAG